MIAILGTGTMGAPMARNAAAAGLDVTAWNRTRQKAEGIEGVTAAASAEEAVHGAELVVTMLGDAGSVSAVMEDEGALASMADGAVWAQMATVGIAGTESLAALADERGVTFVDAPVLGTKKPAEDGALQVLASGPESAHAVCEPFFDAIGSATRWLGEAGTGTRTKLVTNTWVLSLTQAVADTVALAESLDVDPALFLELIEGGPLHAGYADVKGNAIIQRSFEPSFALSGAAKDAGLILEAAIRHDHPMPVMEAIRTQMDTAVADGHGDEDMAATYWASAPER
jgi:3-hydroxyisobutyrate dehydrogenase